MKPQDASYSRGSPAPPHHIAVGHGQAEALGFFHISSISPAPSRSSAHGAPFPHPRLLGSDAAEVSCPRAAEWILRVELPSAGNLRSQSESPNDPVTEGEHTFHVVRGPWQLLAASPGRMLLGAQAPASVASFPLFHQALQPARSLYASPGQGKCPRVDLQLYSPHLLSEHP